MVDLNRQSKEKYFLNLTNTDNPKLFGKTDFGDSKIMFIEKEKILLTNEEIASKLNEQFGQIVFN